MSRGEGIFMKLYRSLSLVLAAIFAITGLLFLFIPDSVVYLFNSLSPFLGMVQSPVTGFTFYLILAVGYMYLVTVLAFLMFRNPGNRYFPMLLAQAKLASSILSLGLFVFQANYLIYLANFIVDGLIGSVVIVFYFKMRGAVAWASR
jgi:hypothetical protein